MPRSQQRKSPSRSNTRASIAQITLRGLDARVVEKIQRLSQEEHLSLNQAALRLLNQGAGLTARKERRVIGHQLDPWIGTWTEAEARQFLDGIRSCEQVDQDFWT